MAWFLNKLAFREVTSRKGQAILIVIGLMVSTAVITGSLIVGDSTEQLVYISTFENLGDVDQVLQASEFFEYDYFNALMTNGSVKREIDGSAPIILLKCSIEAKDTGLRENKAQVFGFESHLLDLGSFTEAKTNKKIAIDELQLGNNEIIINSKLADRLDIESNEDVKLIIPNPSFKLETAFSESFGFNSLERTLTVKTIVEHSSLGRLQLDGRSQYTANVFMNITKLQNILGIGNKINSILISNNGDKYSGFENDDKVKKVIEKSLDSELGYEDLDYYFNISESNYLSITNKDVFFDTELYDILEVQPQVQTGTYKISPIMTYFVNSMTNQRKNKIVNYSMITGLDITKDSAFGDFEVVGSSTKQDASENLRQNEMLLLNWTADQLEARVGDVVMVEYMVLDRLYNIHNVTHNFTVKAIISLNGKAADRSLMPAFPGLVGKADCVTWEPPFPIDINRISKADRDFWFENSGIPKAYISFEQAQELWSNNLGSLTMIKVKSKNQKPTSGELLGLRSELGIYLNSSIDHTYADFSVDDVKSDSLATASGMSIFPMMFLTFGSVIILAGIILIIVIFLMLVDARKNELGMLRSVGLIRGKVIKIFTLEGFIYALISGIIGIFFGVFLGWILVLALNSIWSSAVQDFAVPFFVKPTSILKGFLIGFVITIITVYSTTRYSAKKNITSLLYDLPVVTKKFDKRMERIGWFFTFFSFFLLTIGPILALYFLDTIIEYFFYLGLPLLLIGTIFVLSYSSSTKKRKESRLKYFSVSFTILLVIFLLLFSGVFEIPAIEQFFISGLFLVIFLVLVLFANFKSISNNLIRFSQFGKTTSPATQYALKNPNRKLNRTFPTIIIFSLVTFLLVALSINVAIQQESVNAISVEERGGYDILGETAVPIAIDLENRTERLENGIDNQIFDFISITEIKMVGPPGGTCSNMNVRYPPRLLGVSSEFINENNFRFMETILDVNDAIEIWHELEKDWKEENEPIPIVVDYNTLVWIYNGALDDIYEIQNEMGRTIKLQVIGVLENSIFGGTFIMAQNNLEKLYPKTAEYQYVLFKLNPGVDLEPEYVAQELERALNQYGLDAQAIRQLILDNRAYERSFMDLFSAFLGLGLILGIIGLGVVMARNVQDRRFEIGVLRTIGFTKRMILKSFIIEMSFISLSAIILGLIVGILSSYITFGAWTGSNYEFILPWSNLFILILTLYIVSILSSLIPAYRASKLAPADALRKVG